MSKRFPLLASFDITVLSGSDAFCFSEAIPVA